MNDTYKDINIKTDMALGSCEAGEKDLATDDIVTPNTPKRKKLPHIEIDLNEDAWVLMIEDIHNEQDALDEVCENDSSDAVENDKDEEDEEDSVDIEACDSVEADQDPYEEDDYSDIGSID